MGNDYTASRLIAKRRAAAREERMESLRIFGFMMSFAGMLVTLFASTVFGLTLWIVGACIWLVGWIGGLIYGRVRRKMTAETVLLQRRIAELEAALDDALEGIQAVYENGWASEEIKQEYKAAFERIAEKRAGG